MRHLSQFHFSHPGYGGGALATPVLAEWVFLLVYVSTIGFLFFRDVMYMKASMSLIFWGGLVIYLVNVAVQQVMRSH